MAPKKTKGVWMDTNSDGEDYKLFVQDARSLTQS